MTEFRTMRRKRQELTETECIEILEKATSGVLSLLGDDGYPYGVPITPVLVGRKLYFHSAIKGHKSGRYSQQRQGIVYGNRPKRREA